MASLDDALDGVLTTPGVAGVALTDAVTGLPYASRGDAPAARDSYEIADLARRHLNRAGFAGDLESVVVTTRHQHHVILQVDRQADPLLLSATADRSRTNLAWTLQNLNRHVDDLLT